MWQQYKPKGDYTINNMYKANLMQLNKHAQRLKTETDEYIKHSLKGKIKGLRTVILEMEQKFLLVPQDNLRMKVKTWL